MLSSQRIDALQQGDSVAAWMETCFCEINKKP
jgi:hypothetical protein